MQDDLKRIVLDRIARAQDLVKDGERDRIMPQKPALGTFTGIRDSFAAHDFTETELNELVDPQMGIITGFADLMTQLDALRQMDLGATPPALGLDVADNEHET